MRCTHRCARTEVFPEPAAADTSRLLPAEVIASFCCGVGVSLVLLTMLLRQLLEQIITAHGLDIAIPIDGWIKPAHAAIFAAGAGRDCSQAIRPDRHLAFHDLIAKFSQLQPHFLQERCKFVGLGYIGIVPASKLAVLIAPCR